MSEQTATNAREKREAMKSLVTKAVGTSTVTLKLKGFAPDVFRASMMEATATNPDLISANKKSLSLAILQACRWGIPPDGIKGAIVLFKNEAQFLPMAEGFKEYVIRRLKLAGMDAVIRSGVIYENDSVTYSVSADENPVFKLVREGKASDLFGKQKPLGEVVASYCSITIIGKDKKERRFVEIVNADEIERTRMASFKGRKGEGPWAQWPDRMAEKTAVKRGVKKIWHILEGMEADAGVPKEDQLGTLIKEDEETDIGAQPETINATASVVVEDEKREPSEEAKPKRKPRAAKPPKEDSEPEQTAEQEAVPEKEVVEEAQMEPDGEAVVGEGEPPPEDESGQDSFVPLNGQGETLPADEGTESRKGATEFD